MKELLEQIKQAARGAGRMILSASNIREATVQKGNNSNLVTAYDKKVQAFLEETLHEVLPEARFLGEENHEDTFLKEYGKGYLFVIDPIDGTSNFVFGYRRSVTSIALMLDGKPVLGVIYNPYDDIMYAAVAGEGAWINEERMTSSGQPLSRSLVIFGTSPYYKEEEIRRAFDIAYAYMPHCVDIRRSGSAAWDLCQVASGVAGIFFEPVLQLWDYAAGALIVEEAGGIVTTLSGEKLSYTGASSVIAASQGASKDAYLPGSI